MTSEIDDLLWQLKHEKARNEKITNKLPSSESEKLRQELLELKKKNDELLVIKQLKEEIQKEKDSFKENNKSLLEKLLERFIK